MGNLLVSKIIDRMMEKDAFSQWMGIERLQESAGFCRLQMTVRKEMCNGFDIVHGGIVFSLADSALAFASNSRGRKAVSIETSVSYIRPLKPGDVIVAITDEKSVTHRLGIYEVKIETTNGELVALFKGTVYRKDEVWE